MIRVHSPALGGKVVPLDSALWHKLWKEQGDANPKLWAHHIDEAANAVLAMSDEAQARLARSLGLRRAES